MKVIERPYLNSLFDRLKENGYDLFGPTVRDGAILYDQIGTANELPAGWHDQQEKGFYRLEKTDDPSVFAYAAGPHSWKKYFHPAEKMLWRAERTNKGFHIIEEAEPVKKKAFIGVRPCELNAILIQDRVYLEGQVIDTTYQALRKDVFIVAVNCTHPAGTCFCASMHTGPKARGGFDISLTELLDGERHYFLAEAGSSLGEEVLKTIPAQDALSDEVTAGEEALEKAAGQMGRNLDTTQLKELLYANTESPVWDEVASRCLSCGNCTMVCPTCFCSTVEDRLDLTGNHAERWYKRDSCFSIDFSFVHDGPVRTSVRSRYRQWLTHKMAFWQDQFGTPGCVGCGRCITWCPVGIDITEEIAAIRNT